MWDKRVTSFPYEAKGLYIFFMKNNELFKESALFYDYLVDPPFQVKLPSGFLSFSRM